jgi:hypothetical protein
VPTASVDAVFTTDTNAAIINQAGVPMATVRKVPPARAAPLYWQRRKRKER